MPWRANHLSTLKTYTFEISSMLIWRRGQGLCAGIAEKNPVVPSLHGHLSTTKDLRLTGPTVLEDEVYRSPLESDACLAEGMGVGVDFEGRKKWGTSTPSQHGSLLNSRCFFIYRWFRFERWFLNPFVYGSKETFI